MYLKELYIHGFKTFAEKTRIVFTPGMTCIIGPNGSGKSNISDALLWVLGETNVRELRGNTAQDVIFAGNERRRPLGMAEVSLTIDNSARVLPLDFSEIVVTRRLYRSGESEFSINKVNCRLRDIYELFLDTGVGRDAYALINQGEIDRILSVRAEDRRAIFEEAAGIKKYRVRKKEAERKLEHTQQNLLRVNDIIAEIETRLGPLQRQASAAKRYRELSGRLRVLENAWYGMKLKRLATEREDLSKLVADLRDERKRLEGELQAAQAAEKETRDALQGLERRLEELRKAETTALQRGAQAQAEMARAEERAGEVKRRLKTLEKELEDVAGRIEDQVRRQETTAREEAQLKKEFDAARQQLLQTQNDARQAAQAHDAAAKDLERLRQAWLARARKQAELAARLQSLETRVQSLEQAHRRALEAVEDAEAEHERLTIERTSFLKTADEQKQRADALGKELDGYRGGVRQAEQAVSKARNEADAASRALNSHQARLQALQELGERGEGAAAGARRLLQAAKRGQVKGAWGLLVEGIRVSEGLEKAVEAALGVYGDALVCESEEAAMAGLEWLRQQKGTALVLVGRPAGGAEALPDAIAQRIEPSAGGGRGAEWAAAWARMLLGRVVLTESLPQAAVARRKCLEAPETAPDLWVTRMGQWLACSGAFSSGTLGAEGSAAAALARRREIDRLKEALPELEAAAEAAREAVRTADAASRKAQSAVRERQSEWEKARLEHQAQLREADRRKQDVERARQRVERLKQDLARSEREAGAARDSLAKTREEQEAFLRGEAAGTPQDGEREIQTAQTQVQALEAERRKAEAAVTEVRVQGAQLEQRLQGAIQAARRAVEAGAFLDRQRNERLNEQRALVAEREQRDLSFGMLSAQVQEAEAAVQAARAEMQATTATREAKTRHLNEARAQTNDLTGRLRELMERTHKAEVELTAVDTQRRHLGQQWLEAAAAAQEPSPADAVSEGDEAEEPLALTVDGLLQAWNQSDAEAVLGQYSDPEAEIGRLRRQIRALGPVNPDAVEQYAEIQERYEFLTSQKTDLEKAREQLEEAIREIDAASRDTFLDAFREIAAHFDELFKILFGGGSTELRLTDPENILETGIDIIVQPPGKKQQNLLLLSGGERALTAAAMLFALLRVRPSPFCVLDEVDAPLDEGNVGRFTQMLRSFTGKTQFIVVTHNRATMEAADTLYGVTMEERGVSKVLSCRLGDPVVEQVTAEATSAHASE